MTGVLVLLTAGTAAWLTLAALAVAGELRERQRTRPTALGLADPCPTFCRTCGRRLP